MAEQFDSNFQLIRRCNDIAGELSTFNLYNNNIVRGYRSNTLPSNNILQQALKELYNKDYKDIWHDFCTAQVLLRNNTSIPSQYRIQYPFWMYNSAYSGYAKILQSLQFIGLPQFANFWEKLQTNAFILPNMILPPMPASSLFQTFIPSLPDLDFPVSEFDVITTDMTNYSYYIEKTLNTIDINVHAGEWKFSLIQFTSDGTQSGQFIIDGPHYVNATDSSINVHFDISGHVPAFTPDGNIYLICSCISLTNQPGLAVYLGYPLESGWLTISLDAPAPAPEAKLVKKEMPVLKTIDDVKALPANVRVSPIIINALSKTVDLRMPEMLTE